MNAISIKLLDNLIQPLQTFPVNYFSFVIINNWQQSVIFCNNKSWLNYCKANYGTLIPTATLKYILFSKANVISWDLLTFEKQTKEYIIMRNNITGAKTSISVLYNLHTIGNSGRSNKIVLTFGSAQEYRCLASFLYDKINYLYVTAKTLFTWYD